uniref:Reverse transcriptase domain-containing protein n=1 Tax=Bracon brevicornis TaxID=1563983 RepID=A0A6V7JSH2_9HYME
MKKEDTIENIIEFKESRAIPRLAVKKATKKTWDELVPIITSRTPPSILWKKVESLKGINFSEAPPFLETNDGRKIQNLSEICNNLAETFANNSSDTNYDNRFRHFKTNSHPANNSSTINQDVHNPINDQMTMTEVSHVLTNIGDTSPGPDKIPNAFIKQLPKEGLEYIISIYNFIWKYQVFPDAWREAVVIPIPKPGKNLTKAINYRPISLTCNPCKIMEKIISSRIRWYLEKENILSQKQYGFRQNRSTLDHLVNLQTEACNAIAQGGHLVMVSMDLEKAYEMVLTDRIIDLLEGMNIHGNCLEFIKNFLRKRVMRVRINDTQSEKVSTENGIPQGSVLSVLLFLIAINDVTKCIDYPVKASLFADDLTLSCYGKTIKTTTETIQRSLDNLQE